MDLDGAKGEARQTAALERIVRAVAGRAVLRGGRRAALGGRRSRRCSGRVPPASSWGRRCLRTPALARTLIAQHGPEAIVAALDVRDGQAVGDGWTTGATARDVDASLAALAGEGVTRFVVTSIARDGALGGPDLDLLDRLVEQGRGAIVASGGIASIADLVAVRAIGCEGAIVGRALYEGVIDLEAAIGDLA